MGNFKSLIPKLKTANEIRCISTSHAEQYLVEIVCPELILLGGLSRNVHRWVKCENFGEFCKFQIRLYHKSQSFSPLPSFFEKMLRGKTVPQLRTYFNFDERSPAFVECKMRRDYLKISIRVFWDWNKTPVVKHIPAAKLKKLIS